MTDAVAIGAYITVIGSVVVLVYLVYKIKKLMDEDAKNKK
jgi:hypothetical protein